MSELLTVDELLERTTYMPASEAVDELIARRDKLTLELALLNTERQCFHGRKTSPEFVRLGREIAVINCDMSRISSAVKERRMKSGEALWREAIIAVYGQEAYQACKIWMIQHDPERRANYGGDLAAAMSKYGLTAPGAANV